MPSLPSPRAGLAAAALVAVGIAFGLAWPTAQAAKTPVTCTQVPQKANGSMVTDEAFVARFMSDQLDEGRTRFETVHGLSTVLCAY